MIEQSLAIYPPAPAVFAGAKQTRAAAAKGRCGGLSGRLKRVSAPYEPLVPNAHRASDKENKACLSEVVVEAQCLPQAAPLHEFKADTINPIPLLVFLSRKAGALTPRFRTESPRPAVRSAHAARHTRR